MFCRRRLSYLVALRFCLSPPPPYAPWKAMLAACPCPPPPGRGSWAARRGQRISVGRYGPVPTATWISLSHI